MAKLMPGVESFDVKDDAHWRAVTRLQLGANGEIEFRTDPVKTRAATVAGSEAAPVS